MNIMKKNFCVAMMVVAAFAVGGVAQTTGWLSSYWDGCKPTCSWYENLDAERSFFGLSSSCDINDVELPPGQIARAQCAKEPGGVAFTCWDQIPFVDATDPNLAYGFGATSAAACGQCFEVTFTGAYRHDDPMPMHGALAGKRVIIMGRNTGTDVQGDQIDFMIPGGGLGLFDCFSRQIGLPDRSPILGNMHGGLLRDCIDGAIAQFGGNWSAPGLMEWVQNCHRQGCQTAFNDFPVLLEGCMFHVDFMMSAPNPLGTIRILDECPQVLVEKYVTSDWIDESGPRKPDTSFTEIGEVLGSGKHFFNVTLDGIGSSYHTVLVSITGDPYHRSFNMRINDGYAGNRGQQISSPGETHILTFDIRQQEEVRFIRGVNVIEIEIQGDGFTINSIEIIGETLVDMPDPPIVTPPQDGTSVRQNQARSRTMSNVRITTAANNITATLGANHGYTSYSLIDLRGREIRRGNIESSARNLHINGVNRGVVLLRLHDARGTATTLRTVVR